jgi:hypothetical protein
MYTKLNRGSPSPHAPIVERPWSTCTSISGSLWREFKPICGREQLTAKRKHKRNCPALPCPALPHHTIPYLPYPTQSVNWGAHGTFSIGFQEPRSIRNSSLGVLWREMITICEHHLTYRYIGTGHRSFLNSVKGIRPLVYFLRPWPVCSSSCRQF